MKARATNRGNPEPDQQPEPASFGSGLPLIPDQSSDDELTAYLITDPTRADNPIVAASTAFTRMTGYPSSEIVGHNCRILQGPETDPESVAQVRRAVAAGDDLSVTILNYRKDGTPFWNELTIGAVRNAANEITQFVGVQVDVTARETARRSAEADQHP